MGKNPKYLWTKQHAMRKKSMGQWRNWRGTENTKIDGNRKMTFQNLSKCNKCSPKRVYSSIGLPQETRKIPINNLTYHLKEL